MWDPTAVSERAAGVAGEDWEGDWEGLQGWPEKTRCVTTYRVLNSSKSCQGSVSWNIP